MNLNEYEFNNELFQETNEFENHEGELQELMEISNEQDLEYFLGNIWNGAKKLYNSKQGQAFKNDFINGAKSFGKKMLPSLGRNLGGYFDGQRGSKYGGQIGDAAGNWIFGEVNEAEVIDYVRVIRNAAKYLNRSLAQGNVNTTDNPRRLVVAAINQAARPIMVNRRPSASNRSTYSSTNQNPGDDGIRQGNKLILQGAN